MGTHHCIAEEMKFGIYVTLKKQKYEIAITLVDTCIVLSTNRITHKLTKKIIRHNIKSYHITRKLTKQRNIICL